MSEYLKGFFQTFRLEQHKLSRVMLITGIFLLFIITFLAIFSFFWGYDPLEITDNMFSPPSLEHIMGTDWLGRDIFSRVCYGTKISLSIAFIAIAISVIIGAPIGAVSGYFAGKTDRILSIIFDALFAFPGIILAILIRIAIGPGLTTTAVAISVGYIPQYFRVVRGIVFSLKAKPFIEALQALGARPRTLIFRHMLIYAIPSVIAIMTLNMGSAILDVSGLGFLGLGLPPPIPEWGTDLGRGRDFITMGVWWTSFYPGLAIMISVITFTLVGEGLNEILSNLQRAE